MAISASVAYKTVAILALQLPNPLNPQIAAHCMVLRRIGERGRSLDASRHLHTTERCSEVTLSQPTPHHSLFNTKSFEVQRLQRVWDLVFIGRCAAQVNTATFAREPYQYEPFGEKIFTGVPLSGGILPLLL
jgi:hypothetical protein